MAFGGLGVLGACSSNSAPDVSALNNFLQQEAQATCAWEFKCCTDAEIKTEADGKYTTQQGCLDYQQLGQEDSVYLARLAVSEGRLKVDGAHASACIAQMQARACNPALGQTVPTPPAAALDDCALAMVGSTPVGAECVYAQECVTGAHCVNDTQAVGRGVCVPFQKVGDICNADGDCDPSVDQIYCANQDFKCHVRGKAGDTCAYTLTPPSTSPQLPLVLECDQSPASTLYCDPSSNTCKNLPANGEPCLSPLPPGVTSACNPDPTLELTCAPNATTGVGTGGIGGITGGTCRAPGKVGEDCSTLPCAENLYCNTAVTGTTGTVTPVCAPLPGLGQPCVSAGEECAKPYFCAYDPTTGSDLCSKPAELGEDCTTVTCDTGLYCNTTVAGTPRVCAAQLPDGSPCLETEPQQCKSLYCSGSPSVCQSAATGVVCIGR
ncbi:MAG TPA: hypothetical protein VGI39_44200 [Polyangiaceae bacterium]